MTIKNFRYSLIIPTRNRQATAIAAIQSAIQCRYPYLQIVVSDNSDDDSLRIMLSEKDWLSKVEYLKTETVLSMRDNWERAVEFSDGDYISIIGDDDAVLPDAFLRANIVFSNHDVEILHSSYGIYKWPDYPYHGMRNFLELPLDDELLIVKNPKQILIDALQYQKIIGTGPGIYYGFVKKEFLQKLKEQRGRYFVDHMPDFDSGYATLMYSQSYIHSNRIMFISGHSARSNSGAMRFSTNAVINLANFVKESKTGMSEMFDTCLRKLHTSRSTIVSAQIRNLPEFRLALNKNSIEIDLKKAWHWLAEEISDGYDGLDFFQQIDILKELALAWGIEKSVIYPLSKNLGWGLAFEQGPRLLGAKKNNEYQISQNKISNKNKLVVNGNILKMSGIIDAVQYASATLSQLARSDSPDIQSYADNWSDALLDPIIKNAISSANNGNLEVAEKLLDEVLREKTRDPNALALMGEIYFKQNRKLEASSCFSRALSFSGDLRLLKRYLECLLSLGQEDAAKKYLKFCIEKNPEHSDALLKLSNELIADLQ
jgi:glycosyltransferase involved in cell wall biosynthesis